MVETSIILCRNRYLAASSAFLTPGAKQAKLSPDYFWKYPKVSSFVYNMDESEPEPKKHLLF